MFKSLDDVLGRGRGERIEVFERKPATELVASRDILRHDQLGRTVVACPKGMPPPAWLALSDEERESLVDPPPPVPTGYLHSNGLGFTPECVRVGFLIDG